MIALVRLQRLVGLRRVATHERDADHVRPGFHLDPRLQPLVDLVGGLRHVAVGREVVGLAAHLHQEHALAVDGDLELVRELQAGHVADDVAEEEDGELVLGVLREVVPEEQAAARAERQPFDVIFLRVVRRNPISCADDIGVGCPRPGC